MERELAITVDDRVACVGSSLKADDYIRGISQCIRDLAFSLISPVCTYNCFNHLCLLTLLKMKLLMELSSDVDLRFLAEKLFVGFKDRCDDIAEESLHLVRRTADISCGFH